MELMTTEEMLPKLRMGRLMAREGWNGKGMFIYYVGGSNFEVNRAPLLGIFKEKTRVDYLPHVDMYNAAGSCVPWLMSQGDLLAIDWMDVTEMYHAEVNPVAR